MPRKPTRYASHPIVKYVRSLDQEFLLGREVAELLGCSENTLTYLARRSDVPMGATHQAQYGAVVLHLYTAERVEQIRAYMKEVSGVDKGLKRRGPVALWTGSETFRRRRDFDRARTYRNRAATYREQGLDKQAVLLERRAEKLTAKLEAARVARRRRILGRAAK